MFTLRDGSTVSDPRCGRLVQFDKRSLRYSVLDSGADFGKLELISKIRVPAFNEPILDQGQLGACVGFGMTNALRYEPGIQAHDNRFARELYFETQRNDEFAGGEYPGADPVAGGTSLLAALKVLQAKGLIKGYRWAFSLEEVLLGIGYYGAAIFGLMWTEGMASPGGKGLSRPTGADIGGHCTAGTYVNVPKKLIGGPNSWGGWNPKHGGFWVMSWDDLEERLHTQGECAFIEKG